MITVKDKILAWSLFVIGVLICLASAGMVLALMTEAIGPSLDFAGKVGLSGMVSSFLAMLGVGCCTAAVTLRGWQLFRMEMMSKAETVHVHVKEFLDAVEDAAAYELSLLDTPGDSLLREKTAAAWRHAASVAEARAAAIQAASEPGDVYA